MPRAVKVVVWVVVIAAVVVLLFTTVFPEVERRLEDPTFGLGVAEASAGSSGA